MLRETACSLRLLLMAAIAAIGASWPAIAQKASSCPLTLDEQTHSIRAFEKIASFVTQEPRCFNCHGGVNPHIEGVGPDPEDDNAPVSTVEHGGGRIGHDSRGTTSIAGGCLECHSNMARKRDGTKSNWMTAPPSLSFVGKDAPKLCKQFKSATGSAEHFLGHLKDDNGGNNFSGTAFNGGCGLDPVMFKKDLEIEKICRPPSIGHQALFNLGESWVKAMGGKFQGDESCGCELQLALTIEHHIVSRRDYSRVRVGGPIYDGTVQFDVKLNAFPNMPGYFSGKATVVRQFSVGHITAQAAGEGTQDEQWRVDATVDSDGDTLELRLAMFSSDMTAWWTGLGGRSEVTMPLHSELGRTLHRSEAPLSMPYRSKSQQTFTSSGPQFDETLTVTIP